MTDACQHCMILQQVAGAGQDLLVSEVACMLVRVRVARHGVVIGRSVGTVHQCLQE